MYRLYADYYLADGSINPDRKLLWSPEINSESYSISDIECERELNESGSLKFTIPQYNSNFGAIERMKTTLCVFDVDTAGNETCIWRGRALSDELDDEGCRTYDCEGELAYFNDILCPPSDPNDEYEEDDDVRIPIWLYVGCLVTVYNWRHSRMLPYGSGYYPANAILFDAVVDITDTAEDLEEYVEYATTWITQDGALQLLYVNVLTGNYDITDCSYAHVYVSIASGTDHAVSLNIVGMPDDLFDDYKVLSGCTVYPKNIPTIALDISDYTDIKGELDNIVDEHGGYFKITDKYVYYRHVDDETTMGLSSSYYATPFIEDSTNGKFLAVLTYTDVPGDLSSLTLEFGDNLTDVSVSVDCDELITSIMPKASSSDDSWDGKLSGSFWAANTDNRCIGPGPVLNFYDARERFGEIMGSESFDATTQEELLGAAAAYLEEHACPQWSMDLKVIDKGLIYPEYETLEYGNVYRIKCDQLDLDTNFVMTKESLDLQNPSDNSYEFYTERGAWTDYEFQNADGEATRFKPILDDNVTLTSNFIQYGTYPWTSELYSALKTVLATTPIVIEDGYGPDRPNLNDTTYITPGQLFYAYPTTSTHTINAPWAGPSFILATITNSKGTVFQIAIPGLVPGHTLYRIFKNNKEVRKSSKKPKWQEVNPNNAASVWKT